MAKGRVANDGFRVAWPPEGLPVDGPAFPPGTLLSALSSAISCRCLTSLAFISTLSSSIRLSCLTSLAFISALSSSIRLPCALTSAQMMASPAPITPGWSHALSPGEMEGMGKEWESP